MKLTTLKPRIATQAMSVLSTAGTVNSESWRTNTQTAAQRGYGAEWRKARAIHLAASPVCVMCEDDGYVTAANVVDHIVPHRGDKELFWRRSNWRSLCSHHHSADAQRKDNAFPKTPT